MRLLEPIDYLRLPARYVLFEAGDAVRHLYFPISGVVAFLHADQSGLMPEIAHVGAEGMIGVSALLGAERMRHRVVMQIGGVVYRVPVSVARRAFAQNGPFQLLALGFAEMLMRQLSQNVICKLAHSIEQQFCQRLLFCSDRAEDAALEMTHEQMAEALGARRQGITELARKLQALRVIAYSRGRVSVLDRAALERYSCECYWVLRDAYRLLTGQTLPLTPD
ncbi:MAG TPA: Crp/Fnr family transcriptional regulator [Burkholderiales bacterium]